jgi:hypothetical protein
VVRIDQTGRMIPLWDTFRWYPSAALYADGRLITQGPQVELYPGPALPNLLATYLTKRSVEQVLQWAAEAGVGGEDRTLGQAGFDTGETVFTVVTVDGTHRTGVTDMASDNPAVAALREFQDVLLNLRAWLADGIASAEAPYVADRLRLIALPADPNSISDHDLATLLDWPLEPLATFGTSFGEPAEYHCALVEGAELSGLWPLLQQANELSLWRSDDVIYQIYLHPLLPDDEACPGL